MFQQDYRSKDSNCIPLDMNLVPVYEELKYTGKGIRVAIIDDGIEYTHDDLKDNYVSIIFKKYLFIVLIYHGIRAERVKNSETVQCVNIKYLLDDFFVMLF